jgi:hypothetical protein
MVWSSTHHSSAGFRPYPAHIMKAPFQSDSVVITSVTLFIQKKISTRCLIISFVCLGYNTTTHKFLLLLAKLVKLNDISNLDSLYAVLEVELKKNRDGFPLL